MEIEIKKSKEELYRERLTKWREEKQQKHGTGSKKPVVSVQKSIASNIKKEMVIKKDVVKKPTVKKVQPNSTKPLNTLNKPTQASRPLTKPVLKPTTNQNEVPMSEKLKSWRTGREVTKSAQKSSAPVSTTKSATTKSTKFISVRSRLFDYQSKNAQNTKENKNQASKAPQLDKNKTNKAPPRAALKRRHSEAAKSPPKRKCTGILKRKSCIGSFDTSQRKSVAHQEGLANIKTDTDNDDVFDGTSAGSEPAVNGGSRNVRFMSPQQKKSQSCAVQKTPGANSRSLELQDWLTAKGRTPSKFRHLLCFHADNNAEEKANDPKTKSSLSIKELDKQMDIIKREQELARAKQKLDIMLDECMILFEAGCPGEGILPWLDDIYKKIPIAKHSARFYICKAKVFKATHDLDAVLKVFEEAVVYAEPREEIGQFVTETIKYMVEDKVKKARRRSNTPARPKVQQENIFESSTVVYTVSQATPILDSKNSKKRADTPATCNVITPVRRSTRRSLQNLPDSLKDSKDKFSSLENINEKDRDKYLFQPNLALDGVLAEAEEETEEN